ncbi:fibroblast growth factor receptor substrate 2 [Microplitis demolitor]|uniref:fibroblast growth factor receptor substrate 2 n=1 Tax=Microplitis demolitor TaxID=69319 RepID=UPI00043FFE4B|nr:fibroblast growth factor receptor substrate 2 [Microplitis demolitor]
MEIEEPIKRGLLLFPPQGVLSQLKKTWHKRYCQLFKASKSGIARLEIWDCKEDFVNKQNSPRIITLEACIKIGLSCQPKVFEVITKTNDYHFGCFTEAETCDWINVFQQVAFRDDASIQTIEEDNDLYCASNEGVFSVKLVETEASKRCRLDPKNYTLVISTTDLKLIDNDTVLFVWPYRYIRKYGYRDGKFTFEAGRKCVSGEGSFKLEHSNQQEIFRCISSRMKYMKKLLKNNEIPEHGSLSLGLDCSDVQYQAALTMEAGSRSPLPLSSNFSSLNLGDEDIPESQTSQKPLVFYSYSSTSSSKSVSLIRSPPMVKPKPTKPPRKYIDPNLTHEKFADTESLNTSDVKYKKQNYCSSSKFEIAIASLESKEDETNSYDLVEVRNNAWKTHGLDTIPHNEKRDSNYLLSESNPEQINSVMKNLELARKMKSIKEDQSISDSHYNNNETDEDLGIDCGNLNDDDKSYNFQYETIITESSSSSTIASVPTSDYNLSLNLESPADYDKLQHIGSLYKGNNNSGYKVPTVANNSENFLSCYNSNSTSVEKSIPSWNDYDVVEDVLADSSSRGYGVIRKKAAQPEPKHKVYNNSEYAIVSKPKRV